MTRRCLRVDAGQARGYTEGQTIGDSRLLSKPETPFSGRRLIRYSGGIDGKIEPKVAPRAEKAASWLGGIYGKNAVDYLLGGLLRRRK